MKMKKKNVIETLCAIGAGIGIGLLPSIFKVEMPKQNSTHAEVTSVKSGTVTVEESSEIIYDYSGNMEVSEKDGKIHVIVKTDNPDSCFTAKFQDKMSMDWGIEDAELMLKFTEWISPKDSVKEVRAWNILVVLNRMLDDKYPGTISEVISQELEQRGYFIESLDSAQITDTDLEALRLITQYRWDATGGSVTFQEE